MNYHPKFYNIFYIICLLIHKLFEVWLLHINSPKLFSKLLSDMYHRLKSCLLNSCLLNKWMDVPDLNIITYKKLNAWWIPLCLVNLQVMLYKMLYKRETYNLCFLIGFAWVTIEILISSIIVFNNFILIWLPVFLGKILIITNVLYIGKLH